MNNVNLGNPKQFASFIEEDKKEREDGEVEVYFEDIIDDAEGHEDLS
jgi:hypothetical protein